MLLVLLAWTLGTFDDALPKGAARGAVFNGIPPYDLWEHPPAIGKIPPHGSDAGSYLVGEVFGARSIILIKDVDGFTPPIRRPTRVPSSFRKSARPISCR